MCVNLGISMSMEMACITLTLLGPGVSGGYCFGLVAMVKTPFFTLWDRAYFGFVDASYNSNGHLGSPLIWCHNVLFLG